MFLTIRYVVFVDGTLCSYFWLIFSIFRISRHLHFTAGTSQSSSSSSHHFQINSSPKRRTFCFFTLLVNDFNWHQIVNSASKFQAVLWLWRVRKLWKREFSLLLCSFERRLQHNNLSISHLDNQLSLPLNTFIIDVKSAAVQTVKADHCTIMTEVTLKGSSKVT